MTARRSLFTGCLLAATALAWEALAILPGRIAIGRHQTQFGRSPIEFTIAGTLRDVSDVALPVGGVLVLAIAVTLLLARGRRTQCTLLRSVGIVLALFGAVLWFASTFAAEYKIQRGVDATRFDLAVGVRSVAIGLDTVFNFLLLRRHWVPAVIVSAVACAFAAFVLRRARRWPAERGLPLVVGFCAATVFGWGAALVPLDPHVRVFRTLSDRHVVGEPFVNLAGTLGGRSKGNVRFGMKSMIEQAHFAPGRETSGESLLGLPKYDPEPTGCDAHPMARSLPERGIEAARPGAGGHHPLTGRPAEVLELLDRLSAELHEGRSEPLDVWQLILESFRGDDVHAISGAAPRALAPFFASLYESAERGDGSVIAVHRMWQAGARTSHGFSSYLCGMGMMPYGLSVTRDFGLLPLRCTTDVLADAGFDVSFLFGGAPSYDEMDTFLRDHSVRDVVGRQQLAASSAMGEGGVSDRSLVVQAADHIAGTTKSRPHFVVLMSASNHVPYGRPEDVPADIDTRVDDLMRLPTFTGAKDDANRLRTFAYTDRAVDELFARLKPRLDRTVLVMGSDHATSDTFLWSTTPEWNRHPATGLIPFVIVVPEPLIAKSAHPERVRELVRALNTALDHEPWSQNDVPLLLLTLLAHAPGMKAMPTASRWHTLGGERTSPYFVPPREDVKVLGVNCVASLFGTDAQDHSLLPPETSSFVNDESEIYTSSPSLIPIAATFSRFLNGYAARCQHVASASSER